MTKPMNEAAIAAYEQDMLDHPEDYYSGEETEERFNAMLRAIGGLAPANEREALVRSQIVADMDKVHS